MTGALGYTLPANKIIVFNPYAKLPTRTCKVQTATNMVPGKLVKRYSSSDAEIIVNTVNNPPLGFLGYEETNPLYTTIAGKAITDAYAVSAIVAVHNGPGVVWMGWLASGQHVYAGDLLCAAAAGELTAATAITALIPTGSTTVLATSAAPNSTMGGAVPAQGPLIAVAEADINATQGPVRSLI